MTACRVGRVVEALHAQGSSDSPTRAACSALRPPKLPLATHPPATSPRGVTWRPSWFPVMNVLSSLDGASSGSSGSTGGHRQNRFRRARAPTHAMANASLSEVGVRRGSRFPLRTALVVNRSCRVRSIDCGFSESPTRARGSTGGKTCPAEQWVDAGNAVRLSRGCSRR